MTLYVAHKVYDDSEKGWHLEITRDQEGNPRAQEQWISGYEYDDRGNLKLDGNHNPIRTTKPHWIDHIAPGDYILRETRTPTEAGYVTSSDVEVIVLETGEVQGAVMEDDHTAVEILKTDSRTGKALANENPAVLAQRCLTNTGSQNMMRMGKSAITRRRRFISGPQTMEGRSEKQRIRSLQRAAIVILLTTMT